MQPGRALAIVLPSAAALSVLVGPAVLPGCGGSSDEPADSRAGLQDASIKERNDGGPVEKDVDASLNDGSDDDSSVQEAVDAFTACASATVRAQKLPLDLYFMLDSSGSMDDLVAAQTSKWTALTSAMTEFVNDPASAGIGVGLQFFPLNQAGVPSSCTSSTQCGAAGPCVLNVCTATSGVTPCDTSADCPTGAACVSVGVCHNDHNALCANPGHSDCGMDINSFALGSCDRITSSICYKGDSCQSGDYETPAVAIAPLPGAAPSITAPLAAHQPNGNTPTGTALQGAIDQARAFAVANPSHSVVAVLTTDGIPDECGSTTAMDDAGTEVAQIAASGFQGSPSIKTFAIGIFTPDAMKSGTAFLNQVATSGGTDQSFVISSAPALEQQLTMALNAIRATALPCRYSVPEGDGGPPDFNRVNIEYTSGAGSTLPLPYVQDGSQCGSSGGWYYDLDPSQGAPPSTILMCPSTCTALSNDSNGHVDVVIGCQTMKR
jgi:Mg-chelatase subunit ChlD